MKKEEEEMLERILDTEIIGALLQEATKQTKRLKEFL